MTVTQPKQSTRRRDPKRRQKILDAAANLIARNGYHAVSLSDIGADAGIVGSGVYRHFESKAAILVAIFEQVIDGLLAAAQEVVESGGALEDLVRRLVADQVRFVVDSRQIAVVYYHELMNLPEEGRRRLRRKQRLYVEEWVHVLRESRPELDEALARTLVHAAIGAIQSTIHHSSGLPTERLSGALAASAIAVLGVMVDGDVSGGASAS